MRVNAMLVDSVQAVAGKLYILGGGWNVIGPDPSPFGIALLIHVPWDEANRRHHIELRLVDEDGVAVAPPDAPHGIVIGGDFEVGRPAGVKEGSELAVPLAINSGPLPLPPGRRYVWKVAIDDHPLPDADLTFDVRPRP